MKFKSQRIVTIKGDDVANGAEIRKLRTSLGVSLRSLASKLEISAPFLSDMELGRRAINRERFEQIRDALWARP